VYKILAKLLIGPIHLHYLSSCHSTNEIAQEMVRSACTEGTVIITDNQFAGKGQIGNVWQAAPGDNLTFSLVLRPRFLKPNQQFLLTIIISLAIKDALEPLLPGEVKIKWPNDIFYKDKKIAGILIENTLRGDQFEAVIVGIGLNVNQENFNSLPLALSIKQITGSETDLNELLNSLLSRIDYYYDQLGQGKDELLRSAYHQALYCRGEERAFRAEGQKFTGVIQATNQSGQLIVWTPAKTYYFNHKEVEMLF